MTNMAITIKSKMAEAFEYEQTEWSGIVPVVSVVPDKQLDHIFRLFNRVNENDCDRLADWGYALPSLSSGDIVSLDGKEYLCASVGWEEV